MTGDTGMPTSHLDDGDLTFGASLATGTDAALKPAAELAQILDVPVTVSAVLGHVRVPVGDLLKIAPGAIFELDRRTGEAIDILINDRLVARGEVVLVDDRLGITMTEVVRPAA